MGVAHELLARDHRAVLGDGQVAHAVHLLAEGFLADQATVAVHQHQTGLHGVEVHLDPAFGLGADTAVGHHQGFAVRHPRHLMRTDTVGGQLAAMDQPLTFEAVHTEHATPRIGGVVLGRVQPFAALMDHGVTIEVAVRLRGDGLQQTAVTQVDQVAFGARTTGDEQGDRQFGVIDDVVATLADPGGKHLGAVQAIADCVVLAVRVIAGG